MIQPPLVIPLLLATGGYAAWSDVKYRRLPNLLAIFVAGLGLSYTAIGASLSAATSGLMHGLVAFLVGIALYSRGMVGGGDIKYYSAIATWFPLGQGFRLLGMVSLAGLALFAGWLVWHRLTRQPIQFRATEDGDKLPFGVAIAAGAVCAAIGNLP